MRKKNKLIRGVGINDVDYPVKIRVDGKYIRCPFYQVWENMMARCYSVNYQTRQPTYVGCVVCSEWKYFSNFRAWMETQDWEGKQLDKDLIVKGNKIYSPKTCAFVDNMTNLFTVDRGSARGEWPLGVYLHECGKFKAYCNNPLTKKREHIGYFTCPEQAHLAWRKRKHELALRLADLQVDPRVAKALRERYAPDKDWTNR